MMPSRTSNWDPATPATVVTVVIEDTHVRIMHGEEELAVRPRRDLDPMTRLLLVSDLNRAIQEARTGSR